MPREGCTSGASDPSMAIGRSKPNRAPPAVAARLGVVVITLASFLAVASAASAASDLRVVNRVPAGRVTTGGTVVYRVEVSNNGPDMASDVVVDDVVNLLGDANGVPRGSSATSTQGSCTMARLRVRCRLGTLEVGEVETVTVRAVALFPGPVDSHASVESDQCALDPCDADSVTIRVHERELELANTVSRSVLGAGETTDYTVQVSNPWPAAVRHLTVCVWLPRGFVIAGSTPGGELVYGEYCWNVRRLRPGATRSFTVRVQAPPDGGGRRMIRAIGTSLDAKDAETRKLIRVVPADSLARPGP
jgi:uncharacterized repeat protein (TIGR01451 family)